MFGPVILMNLINRNIYSISLADSISVSTRLYPISKSRLCSWFGGETRMEDMALLKRKLFELDEKIQGDPKLSEKREELRKKLGTISEETLKKRCTI